MLWKIQICHFVVFIILEERSFVYTTTWAKAWFSTEWPPIFRIWRTCARNVALTSPLNSHSLALGSCSFCTYNVQENDHDRVSIFNFFFSKKTPFFSLKEKRTRILNSVWIQCILFTSSDKHFGTQDLF